MSRQPAPRIDPRDPVLRPIKDFLDWLYETVPDTVAAAAAANAAAASASTAAAAANAAAAAASAAAAAVASQVGFAWHFMHLGQTGASTTRRMFPGYHSTSHWTASIGKLNRVIVPFDGTLTKLLTQNPSASGGGSNTVTYVVILSADGGATWNDTALSTSSAASDESVLTDTGAVAVSAGDMLMIEIRFSGGVTAISSDDSSVASLYFVKAAA